MITRCLAREGRIYIHAYSTKYYFFALLYKVSYVRPIILLSKKKKTNYVRFYKYVQFLEIMSLKLLSVNLNIILDY